MNEAFSTLAIPKAGKVGEDHRVRVARERRARMEAQLLDAVMAVYPEGRGANAVIDDVIRHAGVSRGTFYKYFESLDQAVTLLATRMAVELSEMSITVYDPVEDPVLRCAVGFQLFLLRAQTDNRWGAFLTHIGLLSGDNRVVRLIQQDIQLGIETGDFAVPDPEVARDLLLGAKVEAIKRILAGGTNVDYVQAMTALVLRSFGVAAVRAEAAAGAGYQLIVQKGPDFIPWWKPL